MQANPSAQKKKSAAVTKTAKAESAGERVTSAKSVASGKEQEVTSEGEFEAQHELLRAQIAAFEKMLQHAMNRFSRDRLMQMLRVSQN